MTEENKTAEQTEDIETEAAEEKAEAAAEEAEAETEKEAEAPAEKAEEPKEDNDARYMRLAADFQNYKRRTEKEKSDIYQYANEKIAIDIIDVMDNFERALANVPEDLEGNAYVEGMEKIYRAFMDAMSSFGVKPIEAVGQPFNADFHNAVMHVEDEEAGEGIVVEEFQKGYMFQDKVLRYSMVKVAN